MYDEYEEEKFFLELDKIFNYSNYMVRNNAIEVIKKMTKLKKSNYYKI